MKTKTFTDTFGDDIAVGPVVGGEGHVAVWMNYGEEQAVHLDRDTAILMAEALLKAARTDG